MVGGDRWRCSAVFGEEMIIGFLKCRSSRYSVSFIGLKLYNC